METRINVYIGGDIAFTIGVDENGNPLIPAVGDTLVHEDHDYRVSERKFYYDKKTLIINLVCGEVTGST